MKPEPVRDYLEAAHSDDAPALPPMAAPADAVEAPRTAARAGVRAPRAEELYRSISRSYFLLRIGLAILALAFPLVLWIGGGIGDLQGSISAYYHFREVGDGSSAYGAGTMRDVFVGVLWAIGAFLLLYKGYSTKEDWALNLAGVAAVGVALFPMDWPAEAGSTTNIIHFTSAVILFLAIAYVCIARADDTLCILNDAVRRRRFKRLYVILGILMAAIPLGLFALHLLADETSLLSDEADESRVVLWVEWTGIWIFAIFWLAKSREIYLIERQ